MGRILLTCLLAAFIGFGLANAQTANGEHRIALSPGWNLVSSYRTPQFANLTMILTDINNSIALLTLDGSSFYTSKRNLAGNWNCDAAYSVFMAQADTLNVYGDTITLPHSVQLTAGANRVGYPKRTESSASATFLPIINYVVSVSDGEGRFLIPALGINTLETLRPGRGYVVHVRENCTVVFE